MHLRLRTRLFAGLSTTAFLLSLALAPSAAAHEGIQVGEYLLEIGWRVEPAFVGQPNSVQVTIVDHHDESPITDLAVDALTVVVSTAGVDSPAIPLTPAFDAADGDGPLGEYGAALVPTSPGDYTFHITGAIHDTAVDLTLTSGEETFDPVEAPGELEFPVKQPTMLEVATRLDRIDGRIEELQGSVPNGQLIGDLRTAASDARAAAESAMGLATIGIAVGVMGLAFGAVGVWLALRAGRKGTASA
ncbi:MAG TPA: hypothetical protein VIF63_03240 [Candidatus Limnocylindrales bacterium]|jgi:hypothetical protein